jgi:hypothetical protein
MHKASKGSVFGAVGLAAFGVAYDGGLFGATDGHDHSALVSFAVSTGATVATIQFVTVNTTGEDVAVISPDTDSLGTLKS